MGQMSDKNDNNGSDLADDEADLWRQMTRDVQPMDGKDYAPNAITRPPKKPRKPVRERVIEALPSFSQGKPRSGDLDRRSEDKLRRGQMRIEGRLDLHGLGRDAAYDALQRFILGAFSEGKRCVLVITGKGLPKTSETDWVDHAPKGVLKQNVPIWLSEAPLVDILLKSYKAQPKDGGSGALYVYLRRNRA